MNGDGRSQWRDRGRFSLPALFSRHRPRISGRSVVRHLNRYSVFLLMRAENAIYDTQSKVSESPVGAQP